MKDKKIMCKVVIICDTKLLAMKRSQWVHYHRGRWDIPGGAADPGETKEEAAAREVLEEAGIQIDLEGLKLIDTQAKLREGKPAERFCYSYIIDQEISPKLSFEHSEHRWINLDELGEINLPDFYKNCARKALADIELL